MQADADYARVLEQLASARLTPFVAYDSRDSVNGLGAASTAVHVVVRVRDGKVISGTTHFKAQSDPYDASDSNPVSAPIFDPRCYHAVAESPANFEGVEALRLTLAPVCRDAHRGDHNYPFTTIYVERETLRPLDVSGAVPPDGDSKNVAVILDQRFGVFEGRVMPTSMRVDVSGSGLMFWLQVHVRETYSDYRFLNSPSA